MREFSAPPLTRSTDRSQPDTVMMSQASLDLMGTRDLASHAQCRLSIVVSATSRREDIASLLCRHQEWPRSISFSERRRLSEAAAESLAYHPFPHSHPDELPPGGLFSPYRVIRFKGSIEPYCVIRGVMPVQGSHSSTRGEAICRAWDYAVSRRDADAPAPDVAHFTLSLTLPPGYRLIDEVATVTKVAESDRWRVTDGRWLSDADSFENAICMGINHSRGLHPKSGRDISLPVTDDTV